ncbi:MAG: hypothetical protein BGO66_17540 [Alicycliphilus sp. 69-12]|nr:MAG: hypothetical protein BGO66_17540 [Alicycliphilus sp. 69-12]
MKSILTVFIAISLVGCTVVPAGTAHRACELLQIASSEADLAPSWYLGAGEVLERCGQPSARAAGEVRACYAEARNGYRDNKECEALE